MMSRLVRGRSLDHFHLPLALLLALGLRLLLWNRLPRTGLVSDEGEYLAAASWLAQGRGFTWYMGYLWTRAPVYPLFVAAHLRIFGDSLAPIYVTQILLSLVNVALVYVLARRVIPQATSDAHPQANDGRRPEAGAGPGKRWCATIAAILMAIYFPFATYPQVLLSETLYITWLLGGFLALSYWQPAPRSKAHGRRIFDDYGPLVAGGVLLGLATLTRSLTLFFLPVVAGWLLWRATSAARDRGLLPTRRALACGLIFLACTGATILPWTVYNSRVYGGLVLIDTSGAFNLLLGGRTAFDGDRKDSPTRNFVLVLLGQKQAADVPPEEQPCAGYPNPLPSSQAARQTAIIREGLCLIRAKPAAFVAKSLGELVDLFQINYGGDERFTDGFTTGRLPIWYALGLFLLDDTLYVLVLPLTVIGWALAHRSNISSLIGLWWLYNIAVAPLLFAINRFRLPLLPFAFIFAAYALAALAEGDWRALRSRRGTAWVALAVVLAVVATTPYAYLQPTPSQADADQAPQTSWASYLGPHPSSLASTWNAIRSQRRFRDTEQLRQALRTGNMTAASGLLQSEHLTPRMRAIGQALLAGLQGRYAGGLERLPRHNEIVGEKDVQASVTRGDLLRSMGDREAARSALGAGFVDDANPVQWAWDWLSPTSTLALDLGGELDLGYLTGCYLGEWDPAITATVRWCTDGAQIRFPAAGTGVSQQLVLRADGRGWSGHAAAAPPVVVLLGKQAIGSFTPDLNGVGEFSVVLPPTPPGDDVVITLQTPTFIPDAADYNKQQGPQAGQVRRLGVRLDWVELREPGQ